jgi:antirestriction protein ArdC
MARVTYSPEERKARLDQASDKLTQAVESIVTGDDWQAYLGFAAQLHNYSARNVALLMQQAYERQWVDENGSPVLGHVAGYRTWQSLDRQVRKGERGLWVLAPCKYKVEDAETGAESWIVRGFTLATVFEARQTDGPGEIPAPVRPELLTGNGPQGAWQALAELVEARGFSIARAPLAPANGTTDMVARTVTVADRLELAAAVKTLAHELAHIILHNEPLCEYLASRDRCECEAESVAYLVMDALGLATDQYSFAYVAHWSGGDVKVVHAAADRAITCANEIIEALQSVEARDLVAA